MVSSRLTPLRTVDDRLGDVLIKCIQVLAKTVEFAKMPLDRGSVHHQEVLCRLSQCAPQTRVKQIMRTGGNQMSVRNGVHFVS